MVQFYDDYDEKYPNLVMDILEFFYLLDKYNKTTNQIKHTPNGICNFIQNYFDDKGVWLDSNIIERICNKLCQLNLMERFVYGGHQDSDDFTSHIKNNGRWKDKKQRTILSREINSLVYGFEYIYNYYKKLVLPIKCTDNKEYNWLGTYFKLTGGIVTAKHCLENFQSISLKGYTADILNNAKIYIHPNDAVDIAFISLNDDDTTEYVSMPQIMDEVLVMGYPKIPAFVDFLTAEKATVSALEEMRFTATKGSVAAVEKSYLLQHKLALITARIQPGNSGGPVINSAGQIVGVVSFDTTNSEGNYDAIGYGIATPITYLIDILNTKKEMASKITFKDWID